MNHQDNQRQTIQDKLCTTVEQAEASGNNTTVVIT